MSDLGIIQELEICSKLRKSFIKNIMEYFQIHMKNFFYSLEFDPTQLKLFYHFDMIKIFWHLIRILKKYFLVIIFELVLKNFLKNKKIIYNKYFNKQGFQEEI